MITASQSGTPNVESLPFSSSSIEQIAPSHLGTPIIGDDIPWFISSTTLSLDEPTRSLFTNNAAIQNQPLQEKTMHNNSSTSQNITYRPMPDRLVNQSNPVFFDLTNSSDTVSLTIKASTKVKLTQTNTPNCNPFLTQFNSHTNLRRSERIMHKNVKGDVPEFEQTLQSTARENINLKKQRLESENTPMHASHARSAIHCPSSKKRF